MKFTKILFLLLPLNVILCLLGIVVYSLFDSYFKVKTSLILVGVLLLLALVEGLLIGFGERRNEKASQHARQLARENGLEVAEEVRHITYFDINPKFAQEAPVFGYFLRHPSPKTSRWSLLRTSSRHGDYPNRWKLVIEAGEVPGEMKTILNEIARDKTWSKKALEFEFYPEKVGAFCDEENDPQLIRRLADLLLRISAGSI